MFACQAWLGVQHKVAQHKAVCKQGLFVKSSLGGKVLGVVFPNFELDDPDFFCSVLNEAAQLLRHPVLGGSFLRLFVNNQAITPWSTWLLRKAKEVCFVWDEESYATSIANLERVLGFAPVLDESQRSLSLRDNRQIAWKSKTSLPEHVDIFNCLAFKIKKLTYGSVYDNPPLSLARLDTTDLEELTIHRIKTHLDFSSFRKLKRLCILVPPRFGDHPFRIVADNLCELKLVGLDARAMPELPLWLFEMKHLESLLLKWCHLEGFIPSSVGKLTKLKHLNLSDNNLCGELPAELEQLWLRTLILTNNKELSGDIKLQSTTSYNFDGTNVRRVGLKDMIVQV